MAIPIADAQISEGIDGASEPSVIDTYISEILARNTDLVRYVVVCDRSGIVEHSNRQEVIFNERIRSGVGGGSVRPRGDSVGYRVSRGPAVNLRLAVVPT